MLNKTLDPLVATELATVRERIEDSKMELSNFIDANDLLIQSRADDLENATCEQSVNIEYRLYDIEIALCDLSEMLMAE